MVLLHAASPAAIQKSYCLWAQPGFCIPQKVERAEQTWALTPETSVTDCA